MVDGTKMYGYFYNITVQADFIDDSGNSDTVVDYYCEVNDGGTIVWDPCTLEDSHFERLFYFDETGSLSTALDADSLGDFTSLKLTGERNESSLHYVIFYSGFEDLPVYAMCGEGYYTLFDEEEEYYDEYTDEWTGKYGCVTAHFTNENAEVTVEDISFPEGTYYPGQVVPVTVTFSEPVDASTAVVKFNGDDTEYSPVKTSGYSNVLTFAYTVQSADNTTLSLSSITATEYSGYTLSDYNPDESSGTGMLLDGVTLAEPQKEDAITDVSAEIDYSDITAPVMTVTVSISDDEDLTAWLGNDFTQNEDGDFVSDSLKILYNDEKYDLIANSESITGGTLSATISLGMAIESTVHVSELLLDGELVIGRCGVAEQDPFVFVEEDDITAGVSILNSDGTEYTYTDDTKTVYIQDNPSVSASITLTGSGYTYGDTSNVTTYDENGDIVDENADFVWWVGNEDGTEITTTYANISADGTVTPTGSAGTAYIYLDVINGGIDGYGFTVSAGSVTFASGLTPFLKIPNNKLETVSGKDVTVYWTSNICDKNGEETTTFTVTVTRGDDTDTYTLTGTASNPVSTYTVSGSDLEYDYSAAANNTITVTVSAEYAGVTYEASAEIILDSTPAVVSLDSLDSYYILDTAGSVNIDWNITNFDKAADNTSELFELLVTRGSNTVAKVTDPGDTTGDGSYTGSYALSIADVNANKSDSSSYREVYTVTIKAKNGTDSTWSYDSFMFYVYDENALDLWIDGEAQDSLTMNNADKIAAMSQDEILALNRDIYLKNTISANYGDYAWSELADQIAWASSDSSTVSVNYQQGTLYENIENFSYVSYRPTTEFGLSGLADGTAKITAKHTLTGMTESIDVDVETLTDKLYLFQCYPQTTTTLTYTNGDGETKTVYSDDTGAAAIYEASGIASDVYCSSESEGISYLGTFYNSSLKSGEGDWTSLERYPCNNLTLRQAAYAYVYLKNPDGTPYTGSVVVRGGVYVNGEYIKDANFKYNKTTASASSAGYEDTTVSITSNGKLAVAMDQEQWDLEGELTAEDEVSYVFQIDTGGVDYYPLFVTIDATVNEDAYVGNGEAVVTFESNTTGERKPYISSQTLLYDGYRTPTSILNSTGTIGLSESYPAATLTTTVMWWGETADEDPQNSLQLYTSSRIPVADGTGEYTIDNEGYPFSDLIVTTYTVTLDKSSLDGVVKQGETSGLVLDYYKDGTNLTRLESLSFSISNMTDVGAPEDSSDLLAQIKNMGSYAGTNAKDAKKDFGDQFVNIALNLVSSDSYTTGDSSMFSMQLAPTSDPTKFLGFIEVNIGNMSDEDQVTGVYANGDNSGEEDWDYSPGLSELLTLAGKKSVSDYLLKDATNVLNGKGVRNISFDIGGYMESLVYYDVESASWKIQILSGGFNAGGGLSYTWSWNAVVGCIPFTASLAIGGTAEVSMDAITMSYTNDSGTLTMGNDYLTELRIYLYMYFFAGIGFDYSIIAFKLGIYGQIDVDMRFDFLNRPSDGASQGIENLTGQHFQIDGQIGLEFVVKFLFIKYEKIFCSYSFNLLNTSTNEWESIQEIWENDQAAYQSTISSLLGNGTLSLTSVGGQQMLSLNLAPTMEDLSYLEDGSTWDSGGISLFSLDTDNGAAGLNTLNGNSYEYADPVITDDGQIVAFLGVPSALAGEYEDGDAVQAMFAVKSSSAYKNPEAIDDNDGYGDSQISLAGGEDFAVAAWTRLAVDIEKEGGATLTSDDQMMMMNSTEIYASVYDSGNWATTRITDNSTADLAPVVASNGTNAIVAWRSVSASDGDDLTDFDQKDTILYKIYSDGEWGDTQTLYNGTSGNVKAIVADMLSDGTAAVAYTLDTDSDSTTTTDREIVYAAVSTETGDVVRNVRATNDSYLDENPQLTTVKFGSDERFVLGWYTEESASEDGASGLDGDSETNSGTETTADIRLLDFDANGIATQLMPDSISEAASDEEVEITSDFRFTKNADTIDELSILWVERSNDSNDSEDYTISDEDGSSETSYNLSESTAEMDILKGVKFYTYGDNDEMISFTGAVDVAEMGDGTLIDSFDAYVSNDDGTEIKAVILGTTYGADGATVTNEAETEGGDTVQYTVPAAESSMYTATETYTNTIDVPAFIPDYDTIKLGAKTEIWFSVENNGILPINKLEFTVGDTVTTYEDLNLLPGNSLQVYADYQVPEDGVEDPDFSVTATFTDTSTDTYEGMMYLNLPDVEITDASIVNEEEGIRTIQVKLNNTTDAALGTSSGTSVRLGFYSDATYETPIDGLSAIEITDADDLAMIDEGGYSIQTDFNLNDYLADGDEIPDAGITVYIKAEVIDTDTDAAQGEPSTYNNYATVTCENLKTRTGVDATVTSDLSVDSEEQTAKVTVYLQNTSLAETETGNVIVTLLDSDGKAVALKQSYTGNAAGASLASVGEDGLITLAGEEKATETFEFTNVTGVSSVQVAYSSLTLDTASAALSSLTFSNIPGITVDSFEYNEETGNYEATAEVENVTTTTVTAVTESASATVNIGDSSGTVSLAETVDVAPGDDNTITVNVSDDLNGSTDNRTYVLTVSNSVSYTMSAKVTSTADAYYPYDEITVDVYAKPDMDSTITAAQIAFDGDWYTVTAAKGTGDSDTVEVGEGTNVVSIAYDSEISATTTEETKIATVTLKVNENAVTDSAAAIEFAEDNTYLSDNTSVNYEITPTFASAPTVVVYNLMLTLSSGDNASFDSATDPTIAYLKYNETGLYSDAARATEITSLPTATAAEGYELKSGYWTLTLGDETDGTQITETELLSKVWTDSGSAIPTALEQFTVTITAPDAKYGTITYDGAAVSGSKEITVNEETTYGEIISKIAFTTADGTAYVLKTWQLGDSGVYVGADDTTAVSEDTTLNPVITDDTFTMTLDNGDNWSFDGVTGATLKEGNEYTVTYDTNVTFKLTPAEGYAIYGVSYSVADGTAVTISADTDGTFTIPGSAIIGDMNLEVISKEYHTVTFDAGTGSSMTKGTYYAWDGIAGLYTDKDDLGLSGSVAASAIKNDLAADTSDEDNGSKYRLAADTAAEPLWTDGDSDVTTADILKKAYTADTDYTANAVKQYLLTFADGDEGFDSYDSSADLELWIDDGSSITGMSYSVPTVTAESYYEFENWSIDSDTYSEDDLAALEITGAKTVTPVFKKIDYSVTFNAGAAGTFTDINGVDGTEGSYTAQWNEEDITFKFEADTSYNITAVKYQVGTDAAIALTEEDGVYTIPKANITGNIVVTVVADGIRTYTFVIASEDAAKGTLSGTSAVVTEVGETPDLTDVVVTVNSGYMFEGWKLNGDDTVYSNSDIESETVTDTTDNRIYTAVFSLTDLETTYDSILISSISGLENGKAHIGTDIVITPNNNLAIISVTYTIGDGEAQTVTANSDGTYTINGSALTDDVEITVNPVTDKNGDAVYFEFIARDSYFGEGVYSSEERKIALLTTGEIDGSYTIDGSGDFYYSDRYGAYVIWVDAAETAATLNTKLGYNEQGTPTEITYDGDINKTRTVTAGDAGIINDILKSRYNGTLSDEQLFMLDTDDLSTGGGSEKSVYSSDVVWILEESVK